MVNLESKIDRSNLNRYIQFAQQKVKSVKVNTADNVAGLFKIFIGSSLLGGIVFYTLFKYYILTIENSQPFNLTNLIAVFKKADSEPSIEYIRDITAKFIDFAGPLVIGSYLVTKGLKSIQLRPSRKIVMKRLAIVSYLNSLKLSLDSNQIIV